MAKGEMRAKAAKYVALANDLLGTLSRRRATYGEGINACCHAIAIIAKQAKDDGVNENVDAVPALCEKTIREIYEAIKDVSAPKPHNQKQEQDGKDE